MSQNEAQPTPELLGFLHSLVQQQQGAEQGAGPAERTDSDKENEGRLGPISEEEPPETTAKPGQSEGRAMEQDNIWDDFYNEEEFQAKKQPDPEPEPASVQRPDFANGSVRETLEDVIEEEERSRSHVSSEEEGKAAPEEGSSPRTGKPGKKKKKRLFRRVSHPRPVSSQPHATAHGGSNPELGRPDRDSQSSSLLETMSETSGRGQKRRLSRRKQVAPPHCAGTPSGGDPLAQKYEELQQLMMRPLVTPNATVTQTRTQLRRLQGLNQAYGAHAHQLNTLPPAGPAQPKRVLKPRQAFVELGGDNAEEGYSTLRTVQVTNHVTGHMSPGGRPRSAHPSTRQQAPPRQTRPFSAGQQREARPVVPRSRGRGQSATTESSGRDSARSDSNEDRRVKKDFLGSDTESHGEKARSTSRSPGRAPVQPTDMHLKHSSNPALRKWLKKKDREHRKQKAEERKKHREERAQKQEEERKKQEVFEKSEEKVKEWMKLKRKEAFQKAKEDRKRQREEEEKHYEAMQQRDHSQSLRTGAIDKTNQGADSSVVGNVQPQPPPSKFVYKRPVSGRVRLMKLQQERKDDAKKAEQEKRALEQKLAEQKALKMRMSYDQWLLKKREEDYAKRQEAARQREMAKSDPELERIVPEVARRRIQNIQRGKRRIETGLRKTNEELNASFGGGDFGEDGVEGGGAARLQVSGQQKSLGQRPSSASPGVLNPRISRSPRRPKSANPRVEALLEGKGGDAEKHAFKLPFPEEKGVPKYVQARQKKLFSQSTVEGSEEMTSQSAEDGSEVTETMTSHTSNAAAAGSSTIFSEGAPDSMSQRSEGVNGIDEERVQDTQQPENEELETEEGGDMGQSIFVTQGGGQALQEEDKITEDGKEEQEEREQKEADSQDVQREEVEEGGEKEGMLEEELEEPAVEAAEEVTVMEEQLDESTEDHGEMTQDHSGAVPNEESQTVLEETPQSHIDTSQGQDGQEGVEMKVEETSDGKQTQSEESSQSPLDDGKGVMLNLEQENQLEEKENQNTEQENVNEEQEEEIGDGEIAFEEEKIEGGEEIADESDKGKKGDNEEKEELNEEKALKSSIIKRVSFQEEAEVYQPVDHEFFEDELEYDDDDLEDECEDERGDYSEPIETPREDEQEDDAF